MPANRPRNAEKPPKKREGAPNVPLWARATHAFYDPVFDIRSRDAFQAALDDFVALPPAERAFHQTHLLFRLVQGLESVHSAILGLQDRLDEKGDLSALAHLAPIRAALEEIASAQPDLAPADDWEGVGDEDSDGDDGDDPDFIYEAIPVEPAKPERAPRPPRPEPARVYDADREALVTELLDPGDAPPEREAEGR